MKRALIVGVFIVATSHGAYAVQMFENGNQLLQSCTQTDTFSQALCMGYVEGIADEVALVQSFNKSPSCIPPGVVVKQLVDVVVKSLRQKPETRNSEAALLATAAFAEAWPCSDIKK